jgi:hypothetical protein
MKKKKLLKIILILVIAGVVIGGGAGLYMFFMPHRNVQKAATDYKLSGSALVVEYLTNWDNANAKYLAEDGDSKILEVTGTVDRISEDFSGRKVVLLRKRGDKAGVSCSFMPETNDQANTLKIGDVITIKGVIRSGASFDPDLDMYTHVVLEKSAIVQQ